MGSTLNNKSRIEEPQPKNGQQPKLQGGGGLKCILLTLKLRRRLCCC